MLNNNLQGAGLGLRREIIPDLRASIPQCINFLELASENRMEMGGQRATVAHTQRCQRPPYRVASD